MALHQGEELSWAKVTLLSEKLPNDVHGIKPNMLSKWAVEESLLHSLHLV